MQAVVGNAGFIRLSFCCCFLCISTILEPKFDPDTKAKRNNQSQRKQSRNRNSYNNGKPAYEHR
jgi:hypothetical protein